MKRRSLIVATMVVLVALWGAKPASAEEVTILDTLGAASTTNVFSVFGSSGFPLTNLESAGPQFTVTAPTVITEIGGFVTNCGVFTAGVPDCPNRSPIVVDIRPSVNGAPDLSTSIGQFVLSSNGQVSFYAFESVSTSLLLAPGSYFAMFAAQDGDAGTLLSSAEDPFSYVAETATFAAVDLPTSTPFTSADEPGAVRILGMAMPTHKDQCKCDGWRRFQVFKNRGECVSSVVRGADKQSQ
jgi:hypothetical protein